MMDLINNIMLDKRNESDLQSLMCKAVCWGKSAYLLIESNNHHGFVHSVFDNAVNLILDNEFFISLINKHYKAIPFGISLDLPHNFSFKNWLKPGEKIWINKYGMLFHHGIIDFQSIEETNLYSSPKQHYAIEKFNFWAPSLIISWMEDSKQKNSLFAITTEIVNNKSEYQLPDDTVSLYYFQTIKKLEAAFLDENPSDVLNNIHRLIGLGAGLTPSGDDFLMGFLAFNQVVAWMPFDFIGDLKAKMRKSIKDKTSAVSEVYLQYALQGEFSELLSDFVHSLFSQEIKILQKRTFDLLKVGASSGADMIAGCLFATHLIFNKTNLKIAKEKNASKNYY